MPSSKTENIRSEKLPDLPVREYSLQATSESTAIDEHCLLIGTLGVGIAQLR
jgi:hypothetical protein